MSCARVDKVSENQSFVRGKAGDADEESWEGVYRMGFVSGGRVGEEMVSCGQASYSTTASRIMVYPSEVGIGCWMVGAGSSNGAFENQIGFYQWIPVYCLSYRRIEDSVN